MPPGPPRRAHFWALAVLWTAFAVYGSLVPLRYVEADWAQAIERFRNLPPLGTGLGTRADLVANILLFIPLTAFFMGALTLDRRRAVAVVAAACLIPLAAMSAVALEFTQIWFQGRTVSRNDIVAEGAGGVLGVLLWFAAGPRVVAWWRRVSIDRTPRSALRTVLEVYLAGFFTFAVIPLDLTLSVSELYDKFSRGAVVIVPFSYGYESLQSAVYQTLADVATALPLGVWLMLVGRKRLQQWPPFLKGVAGGAVVCGGVEFAQFFVVSRYTDTTDILLGALGAGLGSWWMARRDGALPVPHLHRPERRLLVWSGALVGYSVILVVGFLFPFDITDDRNLIRTRYIEFFRIPFLSLYLGSEFNAIRQLLIRVLWFVPLGMIVWRLSAVIRARMISRVVLFAGLLYAALLALAIEAAQIFMPARVADATEVAFCAVGAGIGVAVARRVFPREHDEAWGQAEQVTDYPQKRDG